MTLFFDEDLGRPKRTCARCSIVFEMNGTAHKYCGSSVEKTGCAYKRKLEKRKEKYREKKGRPKLTNSL